MQYSIASHRPEGLAESNDCAVRAVKNATGVPYSDAHQWCASHGRKTGKGMKLMGELNQAVSGKALVYGYRVFQVMLSSPTPQHRGRLTLAMAVGQLRQGRYVVIVRGHALAVIDGVVHDQFKVGARCRVVKVYRFEASSVVEARERAAIAG